MRLFNLNMLKINKFKIELHIITNSTKVLHISCIIVYDVIMVNKY